MKTFEFNPFPETDAKVYAYIHEPLEPARAYRLEYPTIVVCPGGGYHYLERRGNEATIFEYFSKGYNVFWLHYSILENAKNFTPLKEISSTVMQIRKNAKEWNCDENSIAVFGYSAGAHLSYTLATLWNNEEFLKTFDNEGGLNKPNAAVIAYGATVCEGETNPRGGLEYVTCKDEKMIKLLSPLYNVTDETAPCFIWQTAKDPLVPPQNSLLMSIELNKHNVYHELHLFPTNAHGMSVCLNETKNKETSIGEWLGLSVKFLNKLFNYEY